MSDNKKLSFSAGSRGITLGHSMVCVKKHRGNFDALILTIYCVWVIVKDVINFEAKSLG